MAKKTTYSPSQRDRMAAQWVVRERSDTFTKEDKRTLERWLRADTENADAYRRALRAWDLMGAAELLSSDRERSPQEETGPRVAPFHLPRRGGRISIWQAAAAAVVLVVVGVGLSYLLTGRPESPSDKPQVAQQAGEPGSFATAIGEIRTVALSQGSYATLNTASRITVHNTESGSAVRLAEGEAFFSVRPEQGNIFTVTAGEVTATVLGTEFSVRRFHDGVDVMLSSGKVRVERESDVVSVPALVLSDGQKVRWAPQKGFLDIQPFDPDTETAWTKGQLVFTNKPLGEVVEQVSRYLDATYVIKDRALAETLISGTFSLADPPAIIALLKAQYGLGEETSGGKIVLVKTVKE